MFTKQRLANGLKLILAPLKETKAVTLQVLLPVGSRYEQKNINGVSHFIEHLLFKGTKRRPTSLDLTKELDSVGAVYNAFTSKDHTGYYIKSAAENIELAFDILSDMIFNSTFKAEEIEKERGVITEEINMYEDNPLIYIGALFEETLYPQSSLGWMIAGPRQVIKKISRKQILNYGNNFYFPANMVVTLAGSFNEKKVNRLALKYFGAKVKGKGRKNFPPARLSQKKPQMTIISKETEQVQACLGVPAFSLDDPKMYPLLLLTVILGGNMSSRLFTVVREQHGLAYYIKSDISAYQDTGNFLVQAGLDKRRIKKALTLILAELKKARDFGVTDKELESAKNFIRGKLVLELEDSENVADWYGRQMLLSRKIMTPEEKMKKIFAQSKSDVQKAAREIFKSQHLNLAMIGPYKDKKEFEKLLKFS